MSQKCVHRGCGQTFSDTNENCIYHPGPPVFHEGQKGWACCKARVLTFDEFLSIPPCTTGQHSTVDDTPVPEPKPAPANSPEPLPLGKPVSQPSNKDAETRRTPVAPAPQVAETSKPALPIEESDSDDPQEAIPLNAACKRRACGASSDRDAKALREEEECVHHPGQPVFHEGSKGWTCCKRRVLEFDEFLRIEGCRMKSKHLFVGKKAKSEQEQKVSEVRHDHYQTSTTVIASFFLKKIDKSRAKVEFSSPTNVFLDLHTTDNKRYEADVPLFGSIDPTKSAYKIMSTKLELTLVKADRKGWATLRSDELRPNEILQVGKAS